MTSSDSGGNESTATGGRFVTVTTNACSAPKPPASSTVTVTVAAPAETGTTRTVDPVTDTVATDTSDDDAP